MARSPLSPLYSSLVATTGVVALMLSLVGAQPAAAQTVEPGDLILVERPKGDVVCPGICYSDISTQSPPGVKEFVVGTHRDGVPSQMVEAPDGWLWVAHTPRQGVSRVDGLIDTEGNPVRESSAPVLFGGTSDSRVTAAIVTADTTLWAAVLAPAGGTTLFRRGPDGRTSAELREQAPIRSLQMTSDQCTLLWLSGPHLVSYDVCFKFGPNQLRTFSEDKIDLTLLPDGGFFVTGSGPVLQFDAAGRQIRSFTLPDSTGRAEALALTPDGSQYWVATTDGIIRRFDIFRNQPQQTVYLLNGGVSEIAVRFGWTSVLDGPVPVTGLLVGSVGGTALDLVWNHRARKATGYEIEAWTEAGGWVPVGTAEPGNHARVTNLEPDTLYRFRVRTVTAYGVSAWSNVVEARTEAEPVTPNRIRRGVRPPAGTP